MLTPDGRREYRRSDSLLCGFRQPALMLRIGEAVQQTDRYSFDFMCFNQFRDRIGGRLLVERHDDIAIREIRSATSRPCPRYQGTGIWV